MNLKEMVCVGFSLTDLPKEQKRDYLAEMERLELELGSYFETFSFPSPTEGPVGEVHQKYIDDHLGTADFFVLVYDYPGADFEHEIHAAIRVYGIPTLVVARSGTEVPGSIADIRHSKFLFARYDSVDHIIAMALEYFKMTPE